MAKGIDQTECISYSTVLLRYARIEPRTTTAVRSPFLTGFFERNVKVIMQQNKIRLGRSAARTENSAGRHVSPLLHREPVTQGSKISTDQEPRADLKRQGYTCFKGSGVAVPHHLQQDLSLFRQEYESLPLDQYCKSGNRYRRHSRYVLLPWLKQIESRPISHYLQARELNPTDGGMTRTFERLSTTMENNSFLREMIHFDFSNTPFDEAIWSTPVDVGVHAIRYVARPGQPGVSSPNCLHKDGEPFTFVHLIGLHGVTGGASLVTDNDKRPLVKMTLTDILDTVAVSDRHVYHQVDPVEVAPGESEGYRDVLLIDFTPYTL